MTKQKNNNNFTKKNETRDDSILELSLHEISRRSLYDSSKIDYKKAEKKVRQSKSIGRNAMDRLFEDFRDRDDLSKRSKVRKYESNREFLGLVKIFENSKF